MKLKQIIIAAIALIAIACTSKPKVPAGMFMIRGEIANVADSSLIRVYYPNGQLLSTIADIYIVDGYFELCDSLPVGVDMLMLSASGTEGFSDKLYSLWTEPQTYIEVIGDGGVMETWQVKSSDPRQREESALINAGFPEQNVLGKISIELNNAIAPYYRREKSYGECRGTIDSLRKLDEPLELAINIKKIDHLAKAPVTEHWLYTYKRYAKFLTYEKDSLLITKIKSLYDKIPQKSLQSEIGEDITSYIFPPETVDVGDLYVDTTLFDTDGNERTLSEVVGNSKYLLLDFWSMGCGPCVASIPEMEEMIVKYKDKLTVVGISNDPKERWIKYITEKQMGGYQWNELARVPKLEVMYQTTGIPSYILISPEGKIIKKWSGYGKGYLKTNLEEGFLINY